MVKAQQNDLKEINLSHTNTFNQIRILNSSVNGGQIQIKEEVNKLQSKVDLLKIEDSEEKHQQLASHIKEVKEGINLATLCIEAVSGNIDQHISDCKKEHERSSIVSRYQPKAQNQQQSNSM